MGASVLRNKIKKAGFADVTVVNVAIANLTDDVDLVVTHQDLTARARDKAPSAQHVSVDNFMNSPKYDEIVEELKITNAAAAREPADPPAGNADGVPRSRVGPCQLSSHRPGRRSAAMPMHRQGSRPYERHPDRDPDQGARHGHRPRTRRSGRPGRSWSTPARSTAAYVDAMFEREKSVSTYMGNFLAIPHGTNEAKDAITASGAVGRPVRQRRSTGTATRCGSWSASPG